MAPVVSGASRPRPTLLRADRTRPSSSAPRAARNRKLRSGSPARNRDRMPVRWANTPCRRAPPLPLSFRCRSSAFFALPTIFVRAPAAPDIRGHYRALGSARRSRPVSRRAAKARKRISFGSSQATSARNSTGCWVARNRPPRTPPSSPKLAVQLLNGSGDVMNVCSALLRTSRLWLHSTLPAQCRAASPQSASIGRSAAILAGRAFC